MLYHISRLGLDTVHFKRGPQLPQTYYPHHSVSRNTLANTYVLHGKPSRIIHTRADMILILNTINKVVRYVDGVELSTTLSTH